MGKEGTKVAAVDVKELIKDLNRAYADEWLAHYSYLSHTTYEVSSSGHSKLI